MITKYWDLESIQLSVDAAAIAPGDLIAYGAPLPKPDDPQIC